MIEESIRFKVFILPLSLVITVMAFIFYIKPTFTDMLSAKKSLTEKNDQLDKLKNQSQKLEKIKLSWETLTDEKSLVASALPSEESIDAYVSEITSKASRSGILLTDTTKSENDSSAMSPAYACDSIATNGGLESPVIGITGAENASDSASLSNANCLEPVKISLKATGSWEQLLDFFKYLEDMNRLTNIETASLSSSTQPQDQSPSDLLKVDITATAFFKKQNQGGDAILAGILASQEKFNQSALDKLKAVIYSPYDVPSVSPSGERNMFK